MLQIGKGINFNLLEGVVQLMYERLQLMYEWLQLKYEVNCSSEVGMDRECEPLADRRPCRVSVHQSSPVTPAEVESQSASDFGDTHSARSAGQADSESITPSRLERHLPWRRRM